VAGKQKHLRTRNPPEDNDLQSGGAKEQRRQASK